MRPVKSFCAFAILVASSAVHADQIGADRPGIGSSPSVVPQFTLQGEVGTDNQEVRLSIIKGLELDRDDTSWGAKLALDDSDSFKLAFKASYDRDLHTVLELPANYTFSPLFNLGTTIIWSRSMQTYAAEFNFTPTQRLTITPTVYYESKTRLAIFAAWILPEHDNWQVDISFDQNRVSAGVSTALDLARLFKKS